MFYAIFPDYGILEEQLIAHFLKQIGEFHTVFLQLIVWKVMCLYMKTVGLCVICGLTCTV